MILLFQGKGSLFCLNVNGWDGRRGRWNDGKEGRRRCRVGRDRIGVRMGLLMEV